MPEPTHMPKPTPMPEPTRRPPSATTAPPAPFPSTRSPRSRASALALATMAGLTGAGADASAAPAAPAHRAAEGANRSPTVGVVYSAETLDAALARARAEGKRVFVDFDASWCPSCRQLEREVLATEEGGKLLAGLIAVHVDFDDERNRGAIERYVILGLPTALVLDGGGNQLVRVTGYEGKAAWSAPMRAALTARDPIPALRAALQARPDDANARLSLGKALLERNRPDEALPLLEPLLWTSVGGDRTAQPAADSAAAERSAEVLWTLGRYHHRVRRDPATAQHLWRELATRFGATSWAGGAWSWFAKAQVELGRPAAGAAALAAAARRDPSASNVRQWLQFARKHGLEAERAALTQAVAALPSDGDGGAVHAELRAWR